jgi:tetratricopeptide (TPR) repeat protein
MLKEAKSAYQIILNQQSENFHALHLLGMIATQEKKYRLALNLINQAIVLCSNNSVFYNSRGLALEELNELESAINSFDIAISLQPNFALAFSNRGNVLHKLKHYEAAINSYDQAISIEPNFVVAFFNRGNVQQELKQYEAAIKNYQKAISIQPNYAEAHSNLGKAKQEMKQFEMAITHYCEAIRLKPDFADAYSNLGRAQEEVKQFESAIASFDKAIILQPNHTIANWNKALVLLLTGNFDSGWKFFEWRLQIEESRLFSEDCDFKKPFWLGTESLIGKSILLRSEQGFGDIIQFVRYVKLIQELGAQVILEVPKVLITLLAGLEGVFQLLAIGDNRPDFHYQCPLMSLPLAFKTTIETIPSKIPYITCNDNKALAWQSRLVGRTKYRIGLVWSGSANHRNDDNRSFQLQDLIPYLPNYFKYISLQKEVRPNDKDVLQSNPQILDTSYDLNDFSDTAALINNLDLVISVDTSVAHLAGALGVKTWLLLPYIPDWRWMLDRDDSPWYPHHRLFRQPNRDDWVSVFKQIEVELLSMNFFTKNVLKHL